MFRPVATFPFQPCLSTEDGRKIALSECSLQQAEQLRQQLLRKLDSARSLPNHVACNQLESMLVLVESRLEYLEANRPPAPKKTNKLDKYKVLD
jgi:ribosome biogenesis protein Tsr3